MAKTKTKGTAFWVCLITSICLLVAGFFVPPMGIIDGTVLQAVGLLFGFGALGQMPVVIESVERARFTKGNMTIEVSKDKKSPDEPQKNDTL